MTITETTTIADIAAAVPSSVRVFQEHGIDFCCGGRKPVGTACEEQGLSFAALSAEIEASRLPADAPRADWAHAPLGAIVDHIIPTYHETLRADLPRIQALASKAAQVHGPRAPHLVRVEGIVEELSDDLLEHMEKEEAILFPAIRAIERGEVGPEAIATPVAVMEREHDRAGALLAELRRLTEGYVAPAWSCSTLAALYRELAQTEASLHEHVHLENNILFPRALGQAAA